MMRDTTKSLYTIYFGIFNNLDSIFFELAQFIFIYFTIDLIYDQRVKWSSLVRQTTNLVLSQALVEEWTHDSKLQNSAPQSFRSWRASTNKFEVKGNILGNNIIFWHKIYKNLIWRKHLMNAQGALVVPGCSSWEPLHQGVSHVMEHFSIPIIIFSRLTPLLYISTSD